MDSSTPIPDGTIEYKGFLILYDPYNFSSGIYYSTPPYNLAYFGTFGDISDAKLGIDLAYDLLLDYCVCNPIKIP